MGNLAMEKSHGEKKERLNLLGKWRVLYPKDMRLPQILKMNMEDRQLIFMMMMVIRFWTYLFNMD